MLIELDKVGVYCALVFWVGLVVGFGLFSDLILRLIRLGLIWNCPICCFVFNGLWDGIVLCLWCYETEFSCFGFWRN